MFENFREKLTYALFLNNNNLMSIPIGYLDEWYTLDVLDVRENPHFDCSTLKNVPSTIGTLLTDCDIELVTSTSSYSTGKFTHIL